MIIIGIDPGTTNMGFGVIKKSNVSSRKDRGVECLGYGLIKTTSNLSQAEHLREISNGLNRLIKKYQPKYLAVEKIYFFKNAKTIISVSEARGVVLLTAARKKIELIELTPLQVKTCICGYGRATKQQIQKIVKYILGLNKTPEPDDAADALALAICALGSIKNLRRTSPL